AFVDSVNDAFAYSTRGRVCVESPTLELSKTEIVQIARDVGAPLGHVWVCYEGGDEHCGTCESCLRFVRALEGADACVWWNDRRAAARAHGRCSGAPEASQN
ncbi:7-cyano-7-deazaguanine synthase, partial [Planctomycetota bacterium]